MLKREKVYIPKSCCGLLIGRSGVNIRQIEDSTKVQLRLLSVERQTESGDGKNCVIPLIISGGEEGVKEAKKVVENMIQVQIRSSKTFPWNVQGSKQRSASSVDIRSPQPITSVISNRNDTRPKRMAKAKAPNSSLHLSSVTVAQKNLETPYERPSLVRSISTPTLSMPITRKQVTKSALKCSSNNNLRPDPVSKLRRPLQPKGFSMNNVIGPKKTATKWDLPISRNEDIPNVVGPQMNADGHSPLRTPRTLPPPGALWFRGQVSIPTDKAGWVIGKAGMMVKEIGMASNCNIVRDPCILDHSRITTFLVVGTCNADIEKAMRMIRQKAEFGSQLRLRHVNGDCVSETASGVVAQDSRYGVDVHLTPSPKRSISPDYKDELKRLPVAYASCMNGVDNKFLKGKSKKEKKRTSKSGRKVKPEGRKTGTSSDSEIESGEIISTSDTVQHDVDSSEDSTNSDFPKTSSSFESFSSQLPRPSQSDLDRDEFLESGEDTGTEGEDTGSEQQLGNSEYWTQSVQSRAHYRREHGAQFGTELLVELQTHTSKILEVLSEKRNSQPSLPPPPPPPPTACSCGHQHKSDESSEESGKGEDGEIVEERRKKRKKPRKKRPLKETEHHSSSASSSAEGSSLSSSDSGDEKGGGSENVRFRIALDELKRKQQHPARLHSELWFNEQEQMNDGPLCRCSWKSRQNGIRHNIFPGETVSSQSLIRQHTIRIEPCAANSNNLGKLHHYVMKITPMTNITTKVDTTIRFDDHDYSFDGFSLFSHQPLPEKIPSCRVLRWNIEYRISFLKEEPPEVFSVEDLELFSHLLFKEILDMKDATRRAHGVTDGCPIFHLFPRFARPMKNHGKELLCMSAVLNYLKQNFRPVISQDFLGSLAEAKAEEWDKFVDSIKGQLVINPEKRPPCVRIDQMDREATDDSAKIDNYPVLVHFGTRPSILTYAGNPDYQKAWKQYVKFRHLLNMKPKLTSDDRSKLAVKDVEIQRMKSAASQKRDVTVEISSQGFYRTGLYPDVVQHGLMALSACLHIRFHWSLEAFETNIAYSFRNRALLELAFTHPSYRTNYGTNPDHVRNSLSNCGIRQPEYGKRQNRQVVTRKRGINTLIDIMSRVGSKKAKQSEVMNNERLEYLGDAVIEFLSTIHLFYMFPDLEEGGLATYRSSLVQNKHLAVLAKKLGLDNYMLYAHGPDLCHEADLRHAMANTFEAVMGALFLDGGLKQVDRIFGEALFPPGEEIELHHVWTHLQSHPLQVDEPTGDRHMVEKVPVLQKLSQFEGRTGIKYNHIRLLAKAFTRRNVGYNFLTLGHNQRLEFLGDTVLQLITSEYLYKHFPEHHEGHLSLLRSCLVNNKTQSVICDDLGLADFVVQTPAQEKCGPPELRLKDKADLVEALLGSLFVDQGLAACKVFCRICFYPRLRYFIISQRWNDPKSQLQQCCLTLRNPDGGEPDIPQYKVIMQEGPTNTREYGVAVYFRSIRLATGRGHSIQEAEMKAAEEALRSRADLFPYLSRQKRVVAKKFSGKTYRPQSSSNNNLSINRGSRHSSAPSTHRREREGRRDRDSK